jgi:hypothetical protein
VIGPENILADEGALQPRPEAPRDEDIVDPPPHVALAHSGIGAPPRVPPGLRLELAERVEEARPDQAVESRPLLGREAVVADVFSGTGQVDLPMGDIEIAAHDHRLAAIQADEITGERPVPSLPVRKAGELALRIGDVDVYDEVIRVFEGQDPALDVVNGDADSGRGSERGLFREDRRPGVAFPGCFVPERGICAFPERLDVVRAAARLLEAEDVRRLGQYRSEGFLAENGPQSVDVPGDQFHRPMIHEIALEPAVSINNVPGITYTVPRILFMAKKRRNPAVKNRPGPSVPPSLPVLAAFRRVAEAKATPVALLLVFLALGLTAVLANSGTCDELGAHMPSGYLYWKTGTFGGGVDNPPFGQLLIASFVKLAGLDYALFSEQHLVLFRLPVLLLGILGGIVLFALARLLFDRMTAAIALFLYVLSPNILAHSSLASLDYPLAFFVLLTLYAALVFVRKPRLLPFLGLCVSLGLALATKIQSVLLLPLLAVIFAAHARELRAHPKASVKTVLAALLLFLLIPALLIDLVYLQAPLVQGHGILPAEFVSALQQKILHAEEGHFAYLMGKYSEQGWWYYFPLAILFKTPLAVLLLLLPAVFGKPGRDPFVVLLLPAAVFLAAAMRSHVNIGLRHILMIYPLLDILAAAGAVRLLEAKPRPPRLAPAGPVLAIALLASMVLSAALIPPHQLSYFNLLAGGPADGHKILIDSNYDWGQNDGFLERRVRSLDGPYQIDPDAFVPTTGRIFVNANALYGVLIGGPDAYKWLKSTRPVRQIAYTWFEYEIPAADLGRLQAEAGPKPSVPEPVPPEQLAAARARYASDPDPSPHIQLAIAAINSYDYRSAFAEIRSVLSRDPSNKQAFALGGELVVRFKLGGLIFREGDDYLKFARSNS